MAAFLSRLAFAFAAVLIATVAVIGAVAFLFYAVYLAFAFYMSAPLAALATAALLIIFAIIVLLIARGFVSSRGHKPNIEKRVGETLESILGFDVGAVASRSPFTATAIALLVGILFGVSPRLRRAATEFLRH